MSRSVLITGASRGIGRESAKLFAQNGWKVAVNYCSSERQALELVKELSDMGGEAIAVQGDVSDRSQVTAIAASLLKDFGELDVLVNNAGIAQQKLFTDITPNDWDRMFDINIKGMFHCCQCFLPQMIRRQSGKIINLSSIWGLVGSSCEVHYSAAKAAVIGFTKALAKEVGPSGIQVNCVAPGVITTEMNAALDADSLNALKEETPLGILGTPQDIAQAIYFLAESGSDFITGQVLSPNGGFVI